MISRVDDLREVRRRMGERFLALMHLDRVDRDGRVVEVRLFILRGQPRRPQEPPAPDRTPSPPASRRARVTKRSINPLDRMKEPPNSSAGLKLATQFWN
jgi:hypothetical protein